MRRCGPFEPCSQLGGVPVDTVQDSLPMRRGGGLGGASESPAPIDVQAAA